MHFRSFLASLLMLAAALIFLKPTQVAAQFTASDVIGQLDGSNNGVFTTELQNGQTSPNANGVHSPNSMVVDTTNHRLFVSDTGNDRILIWNLDSSDTIDFSEQPDLVLGSSSLSVTASPSCTSSTMDAPKGITLDTENQRLFVADHFHHRVLVFNVSGVITNNMAAEAVIGQANLSTCTPQTRSSSRFWNPEDVAVDTANNRLYVSLGSENRILVFNNSHSIVSGTEAADFVLGQSAFNLLTGGTAINKLNSPVGISYEPTEGFLYVADYGNSRVSVFNTGSLATNMNASFILGQAGAGTPSPGVAINRMDSPQDVAIKDSSNQLFVADFINRRVLVFNTASIATGMDAANVLGQADFTSAVDANSDKRFLPNYVDVIGTNLISVQDNHRALSFDISSITNDEVSTQILGQIDVDGTRWTDTDYANSLIPTAETLDTPIDVAVDEVNNRLFVADYANYRVLVYNLDTNGLLVDRVADNVLGISDPNSSDPADDFHLRGIGDSTASSFSPFNLAYDPERNYLFVADDASTRVLVFDVASITNGEDAIKVIGQSDMTSSDSNITVNRFGSQVFLEYDTEHDRLYAGDYDNTRVLIFEGTIPDADMEASYVLGQVDFETEETPAPPTAASLSEIGGMTYDSTNNQLFVTDHGDNYRTLVYDVSGTITNGMAATKVLGQVDLTSNTFGFPYTSSSMVTPQDVAVDPTTNSLYLLDCDILRILRFDLTTLTNNEAAVGVINPTDFTSTGDGGPDDHGFYCSDPTGLRISATTHQLFLADRDNNRIMIWDMTRLPTTLTAPTEDSAYTQSVAAEGTQGTVTYTITSGSLPAGLSLVGDEITGTPTTAGDSTFTLQAVDDNGSIGTFRDVHTFTITVAAASGPSPTPTPTTSSSGSSSGSTAITVTSISCHSIAPHGGIELFQLAAAPNSARLYFTPHPNADRYAIYYGRTGSREEHGTTLDLKATGVITQLINDLEPNTSYWFEVEPAQGCATGNRSNRLTVVTPTKKTTTVYLYPSSKKTSTTRTSTGAVQGVSDEQQDEAESETESFKTSSKTSTSESEPIRLTIPLQPSPATGSWWQKLGNALTGLFK